MTISNLTLSGLALCRREQYGLSAAEIYTTVRRGKAHQLPDGRLLHVASSGTQVITDPTRMAVVTVRRSIRGTHDRPGAGVSRKRPARPGPKARSGSKGPRR